MQTQPIQSQSTQTAVTPATSTPQPWVKPTFQQVPLSNALANMGSGTYDGGGYS